MPIVSLRAVPASPKSSHHNVEVNDIHAGEVWRELAVMPGGAKWQWYALPTGRSAAIPCTSKNKAVEATYLGREQVFGIPG